MEYESNAVEMVVEAWNRRADAAEKVAGIFKVPMADLVDIFSEIPAADVAPVVHGRWVDGKCSNCGVDIPTDDAHDAIFENECRFCYYCGATMDGCADNEA
jgi:hypothetical protein